jgi:hypothetical protein
MGGYDAKGVPFRFHSGEELLQQLFQMRRLPRVKHAGYCACTHLHRITLWFSCYIQISVTKKGWA